MSSSDISAKFASVLRRTTEALLDTEKQLKAERAASREPIAIVAMACRLPGGIESPEAYWELLAQGHDAIEPFPARWASLDVYDTDADAKGKSYAREGGFVPTAERFDAGFFGISPREARSMDPHQRLVLEAAWEALEHAGIQPAQLVGSRTGVYLGATTSDYANLRAGGLTALDGYQITSNAAAVISGRLSYVLGLQGPSLTVDTACSSSLVALHLACNALRSSECDLALAGGLSVMSLPTLFVEFSRLRGMAADGRCKSFSAQADGTGWSEGCGILVLKRLSDAQRASDRVLALVRGSAVNQDGRSQGLTAPNGPAQQRVVHAALAVANLRTHDVDAVEAHGTGTALGDPIEAGALAAVFGPGRAPERPLYLGSAKSNLGHTVAAAGVAGVIKMVLSLQHELLPRTLHAEEPSPHVAWEGSGLSLLQEARAWRRGERVRRAGVSSFGISGTNAHVVLEEAPAWAEKPVPSQPAAAEVCCPLLVSGRDEAALLGQASRLCAWLRTQPALRLVDVAYTSARHRTHFDTRACVVAQTRLDAEEALLALSEGRSDARLVRGSAVGTGKLAVLFTGQGSQRAQMGRGLYDSQRVYRESLDEVLGALDGELGCSLKELLFAPAQSAQSLLLEQTQYAQPALFALEVALYRQWQAWGVRADVLTGHSVGELSAAHVAGVLSLSDAAKLVCARGRLMQDCDASGAMLSVAATESEARDALSRVSGLVDIAGLNGPLQTVLSGDSGAIALLEGHFAGLGRRTRRLRVSHAFHSAHMEPMLEALRAVAESCRYAAPQLELVSLRTGARASASPGDFVSADYWVRQVRDAVRFTDGMRTLEALGVNRFLECGPDGVLTALASECLTAPERSLLVPSMRKGNDETASLLRALGALHCSGYPIDLSATFAEQRAERVDLPTYAFQRERYWIEPSVAPGDTNSLGLSAVAHPWLRATTTLAGSRAVVLSGRISATEDAWLANHTVLGATLMPTAAVVELALCAGRAVGSELVSELTLTRPLLLSDESETLLQMSVDAADASGRRSFGLYSRLAADASSDDWTQHASGYLSAARGPGSLRGWSLPSQVEWLAVGEFYQRMKETGLSLGPSFRGLKEVGRAQGAIYGRVVLDENEVERAKAYGVHPALLDSTLHGLMAAVMPEFRSSTLLMPFLWCDVELYETGASELQFRIEVLSQDSHQTTAALEMWDGLGNPIGRVGSVQLRRVSAEQASFRRGVSKDLYRLEYVPVALERGSWRPESTVVLGGRELASLLGVEWAGESLDLRSLLHAGRALPSRLVVDATTGLEECDDVAAAAELATVQALELVQRCLSLPELGSTELVWMTRGAVATQGAVQDLARAPLWGLIRAARAEHPRRVLRLLDLGSENVDVALLGRALSTSAEPELVLVQEGAVAPRLLRSSSAAQSDSAEKPLLDGSGTVLVTGGTGSLGRALARHLVVSHGVRRLLLTSRKGLSSSGAEELAKELGRLGAERVQVLACDVSDRSQLTGVLAQVLPEHPLTAVFHLAGVLDDGLLESQTAARLRSVFSAKARGAWLLHELTKDLKLSSFVLFSSASGTFGGPGQSNYAAANAFLDALAQFRKARGLPAQSLSWGLWEPGTGGMSSQLSEAELARLARQGIGALSQEQALRLLDAALARNDAHLVPIRLELEQLERALQHGRNPPALLRSIVRPTPSREACVREDVLALPSGPARRAGIARLLQHELGVMLNQAPERLDSHVALRMLGVDSLTALELKEVVDRRLGATLEISGLMADVSLLDLASELDLQLSNERAGVAGDAFDGLQGLDSADAVAAGELLGKVDTLSREEVDSLLAALLGKQAAGATGAN